MSRSNFLLRFKDWVIFFKNMQHIKVVCVGDGAIGKTSLLSVYATNRFPTEYEPTVFDNYSAPVQYLGENLMLNLWDCAGQEDYKHVRSLSYPGTDVFLVCYSVISPSSYHNILTVWIPEIRQYVPDAMIVIVALKHDCYEDPKIMELLQSKGIQIVTPEQLTLLVKQTGTFAGLPCSAMKGYNVQEVFHRVIDAFKFRQYESRKNTGCCTIH